MSASRVAELNDQLRKRGWGGRVLVSAGLQAQGIGFLDKVQLAVSLFDDFTPDNDPHGERDCAILTVGGCRVMFKIDYYDLALTRASEDPADPALTCRVMTLMMAEEY
jgi:hypothetical protein